MENVARSFFERSPDEVAHDLVGVHMVVRDGEALTTVRIVETEAYGGEDDPASHASRGRTARNAAMFGPAGHLYVYRIYGVHWCMNVVTQGSDVPGAVLLRGAEVVATLGATAVLEPGRALKGPGNLTKALDVTGEDDGRDCCAPAPRIAFHSPAPVEDRVTRRSPRIGITKATERLSRYYLEGSAGVSRAPRGFSTP